MPAFKLSAVTLALAGAFTCAASAADDAATTAKKTAQIKYPAIATAKAGKALGEYNGVKVSGGGFGSALAPDPRAPGYFYLLTDRAADRALQAARRQAGSGGTH